MNNLIFEYEPIVFIGESSIARYSRFSPFYDVICQFT